MLFLNKSDFRIKDCKIFNIKNKSKLKKDNKNVLFQKVTVVSYLDNQGFFKFLITLLI